MLQWDGIPADEQGMTIGSQPGQSVLERDLRGQLAHADISAEVLKTARESKNQESNAIVDLLPSLEQTSHAKGLDVYG
jgi:hypothetical protein